MENFKITARYKAILVDMGKPEERLTDEEVMEHSALAVLEDLLFINKSFLCT